MKTIPFVAAILVFLFALAAANATLSTTDAGDTRDCLVPKPTSGIEENEALQVIVLPNRTYTFGPESGGFVDHDGALGIKVAWHRFEPGQLVVGGRRLDGDAAPARAYIPHGYGDTGFQPLYLVFPTPGCWEITGRLGESSLTIVLYVEKIGDGPSWRVQGPPSGWRVTTLEVSSSDDPLSEAARRFR